MPKQGPTWGAGIVLIKAARLWTLFQIRLTSLNVYEILAIGSMSTLKYYYPSKSIYKGKILIKTIQELSNIKLFGEVGHVKKTQCTKFRKEYSHYM